MRPDRFSDRMGFTKPKDVYQIDDIDHDTKIDIYNVIYELFIHKNLDHTLNTEGDIESYVLRTLWRDFYHQPLSSIPFYFSEFGDFFLRWIKNNKGYEILTMIEELCKIIPNKDKTKLQLLFIVYCNRVFEKQLVGYRFIEKILTPITSEIEINAVNEGLDSTHNDKFGNVNKHLKSALELFSSRDNPDYRNSIKESISAVGAIMAILTNQDKDDFGKHLSELSKTMSINNTLKKAFDMLYGYTNDKNGIRHSMITDEFVSSDEAKYMLIVCNAFVTYLISKSA